MKLRLSTCLLSLLLAGPLLPATDKIVVHWNMYPTARKILDQYEMLTGRKAPEAVSSNQEGFKQVLRAPDGSRALGYFTIDRFQEAGGLTAVPVCSKGYIFYANTANPFLKDLAQREISPELMRKIWFEGVTWEELTGSGSGQTPVSPIVPDDAFLKLAGRRAPHESRVPRMKRDSGFPAVARDKFALAACDFDQIAYDVILKNKFYGPQIIPLRFLESANGNYRLIPAETSGGRGEQLHRDQFGSIVIAGEFLRRNVLFVSASKDAAFGRKLTDAANSLGLEGLIRFGCRPLKVEFPQKKPNVQRFVFAHAMQCFLLGGIPRGFAHSYLPETRTEKFENWPPAPGPGTRTWWSERLTPYTSIQSVDAAQLDLDSAEAAGLDALGLLIYPGCLSEDNPWNRGLRQMMQAAQTHKVKVLFDLWGTFPPNWPEEERELFIREHSRKLKQWMDEFPDAFLKVDGKPAICFGRDMTKAGQEAAFYQHFFDPWGGRDKVFVITTLTDSRAHSLFSGFEAFGDISTMWFVHTGWGDKYLQNLLLPQKERGERVCWGVSPGYYRVGSNVTEGFGACKLTDDWRDAIRYNAGGMYVQSWNDMGEDHHLLESNFRGDSYIRLNRYFSDWFRTGKVPAIKEEKLLLFHRRHLKNAKLEQKTAESRNPSWSSAPLSDYVHVVTMLRTPGDLKVRLGDQEYELKDVPPGLHEWLLYVHEEKDHRGNKPFWNAGAYEKTHPTTTAYRDVLRLDKLAACIPEATVIRDGKEALKVISRTGIADTFRFQTLSVVGSVSP